MLDSGCSTHYIKWKECYSSFDTLKSPIPVSTGSTVLNAYAVGIVPILIQCGHIDLQNVLYVPDLITNCNMMSISRLDREGFTTQFVQGCAYITRRCNNILWATGTLREDINLYFVDQMMPLHSVFLTVSAEDTQLLETWHKRLGYLSERNIRKLQSISTGIKIGTPPRCSLNADCVNCLRSGQHRQLSHMPSKKSTWKLQLVYSDICGPMRVPAIVTGCRYFITFIDDYTRCIWVYTVEKRDQLYQTWMHFLAYTENESGERVGLIRSDNRGEYTSKKFEDICYNRGIQMQTTQPYSPGMNGVAEHTNCTIVEDTSAMLWGAKLGIRFWAEAVKTIIYIKNRRPHSGRDLTPYEMWSGIRPNLAHLKIFGCRYYALIPGERHSKWESHSDDCLFMEYYQAENLFRLFEIKSETFIKRRDVVFHEPFIGHHGYSNDKLPVGVDIQGNPIILDFEEFTADKLELALPLLSMAQTALPKNFKQATTYTDSSLWWDTMRREYDI